jgi:hypothetical protein
MEKRIIVIALLLTMFSIVFAMSGDGGNVPVVPNKESVNTTTKDNVPVTQNENTAQSGKSNSIETVKDQFGIDTGMKKEELAKFKENYFSFQKKCGIYDKGLLFYHKINLNAISEFSKNDINLNRLYESCTANDFVIKSELVVIASFENFSIEKNKDLTYPVTFNVKIHEVIQNNTEYKNIPDNIIVKGDNLKNYTFDYFESGLSKMYGNKDEIYILFLSRYNFYYFDESYKEGRSDTKVDKTCFDPFTFTYIGYQRKITDNEIIFDESKYPPVNISLEQLKKNVKTINEINDVRNFYKRSYK